MKRFLIAALLSCLATLGWAQNVKVIYHVTTGIESAAGALNNIKNHLDADPQARIVVVTNSLGIDFMLQDAKDSKGREFSAQVSALAARGVDFRVCNNTLQARGISPRQVLMEAKIVPSGVAEAANLQFKEGFAYLKP